MGRFLNKRELVIVVLLILLLDFNGFISTALNHIMYGRRRHTWIFLISVALLLYDIFIFHVIINHDPMSELDFKPNDDREVRTCEENLEKEIKNNNKNNVELNNLKNKCNNDDYKGANELTEKITLNFVVFVLTMIIISTMLVNNGPDTNPTSKKLILSIPIIIVAGLVFIYANIYKPF